MVLLPGVFHSLIWNYYRGEIDTLVLGSSKRERNEVTNLTDLAMPT